MKSFLLLNAVLFCLAVTGVLTVFFLYPAAVCLVSRLVRRPWKQDDALRPSVTLIIALRNAARLVQAKVRNISDLDYPDDELDAVFFLDGSEDATESLLRANEGDRLRVFGSDEHRGKIAALNDAVAHAAGEILVFTDADALPAGDAVRKLVRHFADPAIGGVCGRRVIRGNEGALKDPQRKYVRFDSALKRWESRLTSIPSNDGKLYAIRRALFRPILEGVTDDLFTCLTVVEQGRRFVFDEDATAAIPVPSRSPAHEVRRRRRIVSQSMRGIWAKRMLLNPFRTGLFAWVFLCNRVLRRCLPLFLGLMLLTSVCLAPWNGVFLVALGLQLAFYSAAAIAPMANLLLKGRLSTVVKTLSTARYFCLGCVGTGWGMCDFLRGRAVVKWTPEKSVNTGVGRDPGGPDLRSERETAEHDKRMT